jgi:hypothetical protein
MDTPVSAVWSYDNIENLKSKILIDTLCDTVVAVGEDSRGFKASKIGTHSILSLVQQCRCSWANAPSILSC